ncbi:MAG TPA: heparan-alpha-glucosaminide N-acetyltransferase domain-containing protein [Candidatus Dormibacteraeota bacterium]|nr:heparan-alpha-glucosaminide N-acetyltransferase domain-containing protein [Candidatus Dormibacteraeota bacterium]
MAERTLAQNIGGSGDFAARRLVYIDWMRGLACLTMFQSHCYDSWLTPEARGGAFYRYSQLVGTLPAPIFLFLCGVSFALVTERLWEKGRERDNIARQTIWRGVEIYAAGVLFRVQEFLLGYPKAPWADLLRVDVLNILGIAMILMGVVCWLATSQRVAVSRRTTIWSALVLAAVAAMITPVLYTHRLQFLPWPIESYIDGVHTFNAPQPWLFPIFPWIAFAFAGLAAGFFLFTDFAKRSESGTFALLGLAGLASVVAAQLFDRAPIQLYEVYDYWHTSPQFFLLRCGVLLMIVAAAFAWCQRGWARNGYSPAIQLGKTSLLVYWVHIEFVYGRLSILPKRQCSIAKATAGLLVIFAAMTLLSILRTNWKKRSAAPRLESAVVIPNVSEAV